MHWRQPVYQLLQLLRTSIKAPSPVFCLSLSGPLGWLAGWQTEINKTRHPTDHVFHIVRTRQFQIGRDVRLQVPLLSLWDGMGWDSIAQKSVWDSCVPRDGGFLPSVVARFNTSVQLDLSFRIGYDDM